MKNQHPDEQQLVRLLIADFKRGLGILSRRRCSGRMTEVDMGPYLLSGVEFPLDGGKVFVVTMIRPNCSVETLDVWIKERVPSEG